MAGGVKRAGSRDVGTLAFLDRGYDFVSGVADVVFKRPGDCVLEAA